MYLKLCKSILFIQFLLGYFFLFSQNNTFYRKYNLSGMQGALQLEVTNDGGFIATGQHEGNGSHGDCDIYVYKLDVCGNIEWFKIYGTTAQEGGKSIIQLNDGNYLVSGLYSGGSSRAFNMKIDQQGNVIWIKRYGFEWMMYSKEASNGDLLCFGRNAGSLYLLRTSNTGTIIWSKQITGFGDMGLWLDELTNGDLIITSVNNSIGKDFAVGKLDSQGNPIWMKGYGGTGWTDTDHSTWSCKGAVNFVENSLVVTSPTLSGGFAGENILISKLSLVDGSIIWSKAYGGNSRDQSRDITKCPNGYAILGHTNSFPTGVNINQNIFEALGEKDILLYNIDENGNLIWSRTYGGADRDKGVGVKYNNDNGFSISAFTTSPYFGNVDASFDPLFIKTDSVGIVGCQMSSPPLQQINVNTIPSDAGSIQSVTVSTDIPSINTVDFVPNDQYICQSCTSIPNFSISDTTVCINDSIYFSNTTIQGLTCFQEWNIDGQFFNGSVNPVLTFANPGVYQIYLYSTCGLNSDTIIKNIYVIDPQIVVPEYVCSNSQAIVLQANLQNGIWSGQGVNSSGTFNPINLTPGYSIINYSIPNYCSISDSIEIRSLPISDAGPDSSYCIFANDELNGYPTQNAQFLWNPSLNLSVSNIYNPVFSLSNTTNFAITNNYILTVTDTITTCSNSDTLQLIVNTEPIVTAGNDTIICSGYPFTPSATGALSFDWSSNFVNNQDTILTEGIYELDVLGFDVNGCFSTDTLILQIVGLPEVNAGNDTLICLGETIDLNAISPQNVTYTWNNNLSNGMSYQPSQVGIEVLVTTIIDNNSCIDSDTLILEVHEVPSAAFSYSVDCNSTFVSLTNTTVFDNQFSDNLNTSWYLNDVYISNELDSLNYDFLNSGNSIIQLIVSSQLANCTDSINQTIDVPTNPIIDFNYTQACDYIVNFEGIIPSNETIISSKWYYDSNFFAENTLNPTFQFDFSGLFPITFTFLNDFPCLYEITKVINLSKEETLNDQKVPNVITFNGDGINDEFDLSNLIENCLEFELLIFNRWGNLVFKSINNESNFKGYDLDNNELTQGVYFYKIISENQLKHGTITIIK